MHPDANPHKGISIMMHSVTTYALQYAYAGISTYNPLHDIIIVDPYPVMKKILAQARLDGYGVSGKNMAYVMWWTKWANVQPVINSCVYCGMQAYYKTEQHWSKQLKYCGRICQIEHVHFTA
jgi:hypothetical protein